MIGTPMHDEVPATSQGLLRCLLALAEETASLGLIRTHFALLHAVSVCQVESGAQPPSPSVACTGLMH